MDAVWSLQSAVHPRVHRASDERIMSVAGAESRETDQCNSELVTAHTPVTSECTTCTLTGVRRARLPAQLHGPRGAAPAVALADARALEQEEGRTQFRLRQLLRTQHRCDLVASLAARLPQRTSGSRTSIQPLWERCRAAFRTRGIC